MAITLFHFSSDDIRIDIKAKFENGDLIIDGYDLGKTVEEIWGDSDYEYVITVRSENVSLIVKHLELTSSDNDYILENIAKRFNGNHCFRRSKIF